MLAETRQTLYLAADLVNFDWRTTVIEGFAVQTQYGWQLIFCERQRPVRVYQVALLSRVMSEPYFD